MLWRPWIRFRQRRTSCDRHRAIHSAMSVSFGQVWDAPNGFVADIDASNSKQSEKSERKRRKMWNIWCTFTHNKQSSCVDTKFIQNGLDARRHVIKIKFKWRWVSESTYYSQLNTVRADDENMVLVSESCLSMAMDHWSFASARANEIGLCAHAAKQWPVYSVLASCYCCCFVFVSQKRFLATAMTSWYEWRRTTSIRLSMSLLRRLVSSFSATAQCCWASYLLIVINMVFCPRNAIAAEMGFCHPASAWRWTSSNTTANTINQAQSIRRW